MEVIHVCLQIALGVAFPALVVRRDMAGLSAERLERAWNDASFWAAVVAFGPIALIVHFARTRRSVFGLLLGLVWAALAVAASGLLTLAFSALGELGG